jgi:hypothetical protein
MFPYDTLSILAVGKKFSGLVCACFSPMIFLKVPWHPFACTDAEENKEMSMHVRINTVNECHTPKTC